MRLPPPQAHGFNGMDTGHPEIGPLLVGAGWGLLRGLPASDPGPACSAADELPQVGGGCSTCVQAPSAPAKTETWRILIRRPDCRGDTQMERVRE